LKAQVSSEFMIVVSALAMIFIIVFFISAGGSTNLRQAQDSSAALRNAYAAAAAINYVYLAGDGASYNLTLKNLAEGENITISSYAVTSERPRAYASVPLITGSVNASSLEGGQALMTNNRGRIDVTQ
jgi:uncharacterized protein (UPF0333 family)